MKKFATFFKLSRRERDGFLVLTFSLLVVMVTPWLYRLLQDPLQPSYSLIALPQEETKSLEQNLPDNRKHAISAAVTVFDPNTLSDAGWADFGLSTKQIAVIRRYQKKGGVFRKKEDVRKLYVVSEALYQKMAPFIHITEQGISGRSAVAAGEFAGKKKHTKPLKPSRTDMSESGKDDRGYAGSDNPYTLELNSADTTALKRLRGIGTTYANRIVRFREALGGFHRMEQLKEVYGVPNELWAKLMPSFVLDVSLVRKVKINHVEASELERHPYIARKQAERIVAFRKQHGAFRSIQDMQKILLLDTDFFSKIEPYLDFQE